MTDHPVVTNSEWLNARTQLLAKEKEFTQLRDELAREIRELPWERVEKEYVFNGPSGKESLADLFAGRSQLLVYHFMLGADTAEGCPACSLLADHYDPSIAHLNQRDVTFVTVSRGNYASLEAYKKRMGWNFKWVSSEHNDFNWDYKVSFTSEDVEKGEVSYNYSTDSAFQMRELPGLSVFFKDTDGSIYHTYSTYSRGLDTFMGIYRFLDIVPKGRDESDLPFPMAWVRRHDSYDD